MLLQRFADWCKLIHYTSRHVNIDILLQISFITNIGFYYKYIHQAKIIGQFLCSYFRSDWICPK